MKYIITILLFCSCAAKPIIREQNIAIGGFYDFLSDTTARNTPVRNDIIIGYSVFDTIARNTLVGNDIVIGYSFSDTSTKK